MRHAFQTFLLLYPAHYRNLFGREMVSVFERAAGDFQSRGLPAWCTFLCVEFAGLIAGAFSAWTDEYMQRSRRRPTASFVISIAGGAAITAIFQSFVYGGLARRSAISMRQMPDSPPVPHDYMLPLVLAGGTLLFISVFSIAFVWNMRIIGTRAGRLKPIWMPGRNNARIARRDETLHRNAGRQRHPLHRQIR